MSSAEDQAQKSNPKRYSDFAFANRSSSTNCRADSRKLGVTGGGFL